MLYCSSILKNNQCIHYHKAKVNNNTSCINKLGSYLVMKLYNTDFDYILINHKETTAYELAKKELQLSTNEYKLVLKMYNLKYISLAYKRCTSWQRLPTYNISYNAIIEIFSPRVILKRTLNPFL